MSHILKATLLTLITSITLSGTALAQQYDGTPAPVIAMNTMECVTYYTAYADSMDDSRFHEKEALTNRASFIIAQNTPEGEAEAYLSDAEEARANAVFLTNRIQKGVVSQADIIGLVTNCDQSFGFEADLTP